MPEKVRERFVVDGAFEEGVELSDRERMEIASRLSSLLHTVVLGVLSPDRVKVLQPSMKVRYAHRHESTMDRSCPYCVSYADDEQNSSTIA